MKRVYSGDELIGHVLPFAEYAALGLTSLEFLNAIPDNLEFVRTLDGYITLLDLEYLRIVDDDD